MGIYHCQHVCACVRACVRTCVFKINNMKDISEEWRFNVFHQLINTGANIMVDTGGEM